MRLPIRVTSKTTSAEAVEALLRLKALPVTGRALDVATCRQALSGKALTATAAAAEAVAAAALAPAGATDFWWAAYLARLGAARSVSPDRAKVWADAVEAAFAASQVVGGAPTPPPPPPPPPPVQTSGKYRCAQLKLFQPIPAALIPNRLPGGAPMSHEMFGPTAIYVDSISGWPWDREGGDWVDAGGVRWGPAPWATVETDPQAAAPFTKRYSTDATALVKACQAQSRWLAVRLTCASARTLAGAASANPPTVTLEYDDGSTETRAAWCVAAISNSRVPDTSAPTVSLPCFVEFDRPTRAVKSARMSLTVTEHWSGSNTGITVMLLDPPVHREPARPGPSEPAGIIGEHDYADGTTLDDVMHPVALNHSDERHFDPAIYGSGPTDTSKLPHLGAGKWILSSEDRANWSLVGSSYRGEGFAPLAPGVGAMRIVMPAVPKVVDGTEVRYSGTVAANGMIFLPEPMFGRLDRVFVRYYFRLAGPYAPTPADRKQVRNEAGGSAVWSTMAGKFGIGPDHSTGWGGVSGTSGGPGGWQMRGSWYDCDAGLGGPDEGGWAVGHHLYDFNYRNPQGYNYSKDYAAEWERWGQRGGIGGMLYADQWYCLETEMKLNTISDTAPGFLPDGELRTWVDGRLVYERTGMVFRNGPVLRPAYVNGQIRPARDLGIRGLWLNWFHGGKTLATFDRTTFYTGLKWGIEYIGPSPRAALAPSKPL